MAATFRVAQSQIVKTSAERRLPSTDSVLTMLKWIERHFGKRLPRENSVGNLSNNLQMSLGEIEMELSMPEEKFPQ
jgi:trehalose 6-phosphate synthase/phosphatase